MAVCARDAAALRDTCIHESRLSTRLKTDQWMALHLVLHTESGIGGYSTCIPYLQRLSVSSVRTLLA